MTLLAEVPVWVYLLGPVLATSIPVLLTFLLARAKRIDERTQKIEVLVNGHLHNLENRLDEALEDLAAYKAERRENVQANEPPSGDPPPSTPPRPDLPES